MRRFSYLTAPIFGILLTCTSAFNYVELSNTCKSAVLFAIEEDLASCPQLSLTVNNGTETSACAGGAACWTSFGSLFPTMPTLGSPLTTPLPPNLCPLCAASPNFSACEALVDQALVAVSPEVNATASQLCNRADRAILLLLRDEMAVICSSSGGQLTISPGQRDMTVLSQCGLCKVMPCSPGMYCDGVNPVRECKPGYYCPDGLREIACPEGYFCPLGAIAPTECRSSASCPEGASREVVYVPLLISLLIFAALFAYLRYLRAISKIGVYREAKSSAGRLISGPTVVFQDVSLVTNGVARLQSVSGRILPGRLTAIMGGSGAGKTTLMNVLLDKERRTAGQVDVLVPKPDRSTEKVSHVRDILGLVPQTDVMLRELTVREVIQHSALSRLPRSMPYAKKLATVDAVIDTLRLHDIEHKVIGEDGAATSITPSQRKLVNIGIELAAQPSLLFLDEPTTGLDATSALRVMYQSKAIAQQGMTLAAIIHQPRQEIFALLDDLILLASGGRTAYAGAANGILPYLESLGYVCPTYTNGCDFMMDVVNGKYGPPVRGLAEGLPVPEDLPAAWLQFIGNTKQQQQQQQQQRQALPAQTDGNLSPSSQKAHGATFLQQLVLNAQRAFAQHIRGGSLFSDITAMMLGGVVMGIVASGGDLVSPPIPSNYYFSCPLEAEFLCQSVRRLMVAPLTFYVTMTIGALGIPIAVRTFGQEKEVFWRERSTGSSGLAYFLAKVLVDVPYSALLAFMFLAPMVAIAPWRAPTEGLYVYCAATLLFVFALGYLLSALFDSVQSASLTGVIVAVLANLFGGFVPMIGTFGMWAYTHWAQRALITLEMFHGYGLSKAIFNDTVNDEWRDPAYGADLAILCAFAAAVAIAAYVALIRRHVDKQR